MNIITFKRSSKKLITVLLYIALLIFTFFLPLSVYADTLDKENVDFIESVKELAPTPLSRVFTIIIFVILCVLMLYLKFRKGSVNNE